MERKKAKAVWADLGRRKDAFLKICACLLALLPCLFFFSCSCNGEKASKSDDDGSSTPQCVNDADCLEGKKCNYNRKCVEGYQPADGGVSPDDAGQNDEETAPQDDPLSHIKQDCRSCSTPGAFCTLDDRCVEPGAPFQPYPIKVGYDVPGREAPDAWPFNDPSAVVLSTYSATNYLDIYDGLVAWIQRVGSPIIGSQIRYYDIESGREWAFPSVDSGWTLGVSVPTQRFLVFSSEHENEGKYDGISLDIWDFSSSQRRTLVPNDSCCQLSFESSGARGNIAVAQQMVGYPEVQSHLLLYVNRTTYSFREIPNVGKVSEFFSCSLNSIIFSGMREPADGIWVLKLFDADIETTSELITPEELGSDPGGGAILNTISPDGNWVTSTIIASEKRGVILLHIPTGRYELLTNAFGSTVTNDLLIYLKDVMELDGRSAVNIIIRDINSGFECIFTPTPGYYAIIPWAWRNYVLILTPIPADNDSGALALIDLEKAGFTDSAGKLRPDCGDPSRMKKK